MGRGGKEDIHVLLTEWRRKIKIKMHARTKGQGMETNPLHALRTGVSVARCNLHMLINMFYSLSYLRFAWVTAKTKKTRGTWELGLFQKALKGFSDGVKNFHNTSARYAKQLVVSCFDGVRSHHVQLAPIISSAPAGYFLNGISLILFSLSIDYSTVFQMVASF